MKPRLIVRRYTYEDPYHTQIEFLVSNGLFSGSTDIYCNVEDLKKIGEALQDFPKKIGDEYRYEYGSENPAARAYRYFLLRAYTTDSVGHSAIQIAINLHLDALLAKPLRGLMATKNHGIPPVFHRFEV